MNQHKNHFEVVKQTEIATLIENSQRGRILSLTYDPSLAHTREMLFAGAGFRVSTFRDVNKAIAACQASEFDLIVVGHSIPLAERRSLVKEVRELCMTPVLALLRQGEPRLPEADYYFDSSENPALLLKTVIKILRPEQEQDDVAGLPKA